MRFASLAPAALALALLAPPRAAAADDVVQVGGTSFRVTLQWTAPGDDSTLGRAARYDLRYSGNPIDALDWGQATPVPGLSAPGLPGSTNRVTLVGLDSTRTWWFAVRTADERDNWSPLSNVVHTTPPPIGIDDRSGPAAFSRPAPNPAREGVRFDLWLPVPEAVRVTAFDAAGRAVRRLAEGPRPAGASALAWDLRDQGGRPLPAGLYLVRAELPQGAVTRRVIVSR